MLDLNSTNNESSSADGKTFGIGEVSRLTGLSVHNLRAWERRYGAVVAARTDTGRRSYRQSDIDRLFLLKACIDNGHRIRRVAKLSDEELAGLVEAKHHLPRASVTSDLASLEAVVYSDTDIETQNLPVTVVTYSSEIREIEQSLEQGNRLLLVFLESITAQSGNLLASVISRYRPVATAVAYYFSDSKSLARLKRAGALVKKAPTDYASMIEELLNAGAESSRDAAWVQPGLRKSPRYSRPQLARIANLKSKLQCECPCHLSELITQLSAFERYSIECLIQDNNDAVVHQAMADAGAHARSTIEDALAFLLEREEIDPSEWL